MLSVPLACAVRPLMRYRFNDAKPRRAAMSYDVLVKDRFHCEVERTMQLHMFSVLQLFSLILRVCHHALVLVSCLGCQTYKDMYFLRGLVCCQSGQIKVLCMRSRGAGVQPYFGMCINM